MVAKLALLLPAYNEEQTVEATIRSFHAFLPHASIWVIDNCSTDATQTIARSTILSIGCSGGVLFEGRKGKGNAVRCAFRAVEADVYVLADADSTYPAEQAPALIDLILNNVADLVVGDRISSGYYDSQNKRYLHGFGNRLVRFLVNSLFKASLNDIMSGYRVMSRRFVKSYPILVEGFEIETDMTLHALDKRFRIKEIPVSYYNRPVGSASKLSTFSDGFRVIFTIMNILRYYKPLVFFGGLGICISALGFIIAIPVFDDWLQYRYIYHVPLALLSTGLEIVAVLMLTVGLILDSISHHNKLSFELLTRDLKI
jgi:glycosyltransferase involved in cell wall biosynthesis